MRRAIGFLAILLIPFLSCRGEETRPPDDFAFTDPEQIGDYILPQFREELLRQQKYSHLYRINIEVNRKQATARGGLHISWYNGSGSDLSELRFRLLMNSKERSPMSIASVKRGEKDLAYTLSEDNSVLIVDLEGKLPHGASSDFTISYNIDFSPPPTYYFNFARIDDDGFSIPHFYPVAARNRRGQWEEDPPASGGDLLSADSSHFFVEVVADRDIPIIASGREAGSREEGEKQIRSYIAGPVRDFYIGAGASLKEVKGDAGEIEITSYAPPELRGASSKAVEATSYALSIFSREFGPYPFREIKIAAMPMSALGVEFPGLFAINENLYREPGGYLFEPTVVHETAHQWFYSLLGNNQLREPWIDEALAQYAMWLYYSERYGSSGAGGVYNSFLDRWDRVSSEAISIGEAVAYYKDKEYASIIYGRGPLFFLDVREVMGEESFHAFLRDLLTVYSHRIIDGEAFLNELRDRGGSAVESIIGEYFD